MAVLLMRLDGNIQEFISTTVLHRLISWFHRQAKTEDAIFALGTSHQELAAQIGTVRELLTRNLARLKAQGFISINAHELRVLDQARLEAELASIV